MAIIASVNVSLFNSLLIVLFIGLLILMFWTSGHVPYGFQNHSVHPYLHLVEVYVIHSLKYTSGVTPVTPFPQALVGLKTRIYHAATDSLCETRQMFYQLSYASLANPLLIIHSLLPIIWFPLFQTDKIP